MKNLALMILAGCAFYAAGELLYNNYIVSNEENKVGRSSKKWGDMSPPSRYAEYCKRTGLQWNVSWQSDYRNGDLKEDWELNENGDSILTMLHYHKVWSDDSELSPMELSRINRGREIAKEQWSRIKQKTESGEINSKKKLFRYSGE